MYNLSTIETEIKNLQTAKASLEKCLVYSFPTAVTDCQIKIDYLEMLISTKQYIVKDTPKNEGQTKQNAPFKAMAEK